MDDGEVFGELIAMVERMSPELANEIRAEVGRGRDVSGAELSLALPRERGVSSSDMGRVAYTDDEAAQLLYQALQTTVRTVARSRKALRSLIDNYEVPSTRVRFADPDEAGTEEWIIDLDRQMLDSVTRLDNIDELLSPDTGSAS